MRIRQWGRLPLRRGPTVLVANHQHEDESEIICERTFVQGPWRHPVFAASSRRMYEPGFFAQRLPAFALARRWNAAPLFLALGLLPLENELSTRPLSSLAHEVSRAHGDLPLREVFREDALRAVPGASRCGDLLETRFFDAAQQPVKLSLLNEPYRAEALRALRATVDEDIARICEVVRAGATFYVTPEGFYSSDGRMRRLRGIIDRLVPIADVWLAAIAFDPFRGRRLSMLYRVVRPADRDDLATSLAAARPVTTSALLATVLARLGHERATRAALRAAVRAELASLPAGTFVDPELRRRPDRCVDEALATLVARATLLQDGERFRTGPVRSDPRFHGADPIAFQSNVHAETVAGAARLAERGVLHSHG